MAKKIEKKSEKKLTLEQLIEKADNAKKKNPLDLSSDQDLTIALMNLVSLEEHFFFSGGKTGKPGFYDLINIVRDMRGELMKRVVDRDGHDGGEVWCISKHLLAASMRLMEVGTKALGAGDKKEAYDMFNKAYELYSLFWGINMNLIDLKGTEKIEDKLPHGLDIWVGDVKSGAKSKQSAPAKSVASVAATSANTGLTSKLGNWVKNAVNCCIE
ncbi:MAG: hypothetical protein FWF34_01590 [Alphaproteobacteria bacterium]|nr:hypothetical protein [Alphaproteobacteria bacterium]MCL2889930.1 hypothetical protein [Alphaproteobacteria bacterium]